MEEQNRNLLLQIIGQINLSIREIQNKILQSSQHLVQIYGHHSNLKKKQFQKVEQLLKNFQIPFVCLSGKSLLIVIGTNSPKQMKFTIEIFFLIDKLFQQFQEMDRNLKTITFIIQQQTILWIYKKQLMKAKKTISEKVLLKQNEIFELSPLENNTSPYYKSVRVELSQKLKSSKRKKSPNNDNLCYPRWNDDNLCYTPGFILAQDQRVFNILKESFKDGYLSHIEKISDKSTNNSQLAINLPYPQEQSYCGVCKSSYQKFEDHINSKQHKLSCRRSPYTKHILQFCEGMNDGFEATKFKNLEDKQKLQYRKLNESYVCQSIKMQNPCELSTNSIQNVRKSHQFAVDEPKQDQILQLPQPQKLPCGN